MSTTKDPLTRDEICVSDRGEREYYYSKRDLKNQIKLPLTTDGCEALLEIVTAVMDFPLDERARQIFAGYIHGLPKTAKSCSLDDLVTAFHNDQSKYVTWKLDQDSKERMAQKQKADEEAAKLAKDKEAETTTTPLTLAQDANESGKGDTNAVQ